MLAMCELAPIITVVGVLATSELSRVLKETAILAICEMSPIFSVVAVLCTSELA